MSVQFNVDKSARRVHVRLSGTVAVGEVIEAVKGVLASPDYEPGFEVLSDHTQVTTSLTPDATKSWIGLLDGAAERVRGTRWAAVAVTPAAYGMMRMVSALVKDTLTLEVFDTLEDAERWLEATRER